MSTPRKIPPSVARKLGHYVYLYVDPRDDTVFYVGKGIGNRALAHLKAPEEKAIATRIAELQGLGLEPEIDILIHGLPTSEVALRVEAAAIDLLGVSTLANEVKGWGSRQFGRMALGDAIAHYQHRPVTIKEPSLLIRINRNFRYGMSPAELYDATRGAWKVGRKNREAVALAFSVYQNVVREVYSVAGWHRGGFTFSGRFETGRDAATDRWEFVGAPASEEVRDKYLNGYVGAYFSQGAQNPIAYVNLE